MTVTPLAGQVGHGRGAATGDIGRSAGPVVVARGLRRVRLYNAGCGCTRGARRPGGPARRRHPARGELATVQVYGEHERTARR